VQAIGVQLQITYFQKSLQSSSPVFEIFGYFDLVLSVLNGTHQSMLKSGSEVFNRVGRLVARGQPNKSQRHRVWMLRNRSNFKASWGFVPFLFGTSPSCQVFWVIGWGVWQSYVIWPTFMLSCIWKSRHYAFSICSLLSNLIDRRCYTVWIQKFPCCFLTFFPNGWEFLNNL